VDDYKPGFLSGAGSMNNKIVRMQIGNVDTRHGDIIIIAEATLNTIRRVKRVPIVGLCIVQEFCQIYIAGGMDV